MWNLILVINDSKCSCFEDFRVSTGFNGIEYKHSTFKVGQSDFVI